MKYRNIEEATAALGFEPRNLAELEAGIRCEHKAVPVTMHAKRNVLKAMGELIAKGERSLVDALDKAGDNTDTGTVFLCRYDLRTAVGHVLARAASELNKAKRANKLADIVRHAIDTLETPRLLVPKAPAVAMDSDSRRAVA